MIQQQDSQLDKDIQAFNYLQHYVARCHYVTYVITLFSHITKQAGLDFVMHYSREVVRESVHKVTLNSMDWKKKKKKRDDQTLMGHYSKTTNVASWCCSMTLLIYIYIYNIYIIYIYILYIYVYIGGVGACEWSKYQKISFSEA